eukprot:TRINITY_DN15390_c0_g1_i1.p1 TRINITY_DN15390_c0_g1~~TRINITY_DN15390_c0_g1_i1.p1  ORF type:complete len:447 (+),score=86.86 TRINITY_DN15390_c0_g1_i1:45-1343(+)
MAAAEALEAQQRRRASSSSLLEFAPTSTVTLHGPPPEALELEAYFTAQATEAASQASGRAPNGALQRCCRGWNAATSQVRAKPARMRDDTMSSQRPALIISRLASSLAYDRAESGAAAATMPRVWEIWDEPGIGGQTRFRCGGRCVIGPPIVDEKFSLCMWLSILPPTLFFFLVCGPHTKINCPWLPPCTVAFAVAVIVFSFLTSNTDPGIIPKPALQLLVPGLKEEVAAEVGLPSRLADGRPSAVDLYATAPDPALMEELHPLGFWWCKWCRMVQPPRAKHCRDCNCCVLRLDHHCPFLNTCIGQRNYAYFCGFVASVCLLGACVIWGTWLWIQSEEPRRCIEDPRGCGASSPLLLSTVLSAGFLLTTVAMLLALLASFGLFHVLLILRGSTTREAISGSTGGDGPMLLAPRGPSLLHARERICVPEWLES